MSDHFARAQLVKLEVDRLLAEAKRCRDIDRLKAIHAEMSVLNDSMLEIRREQLREEIEHANKPRGWWARIVARANKRGGETAGYPPKGQERA